MRETSEPAGSAPEPVASAKPADPPIRKAADPPEEPPLTEEPDPKPKVTAAAPGPAPIVPDPAPDPRLTRPEFVRDPLRAMQEAEARRLQDEQLVIRLAAERDAAAALVVRRERDLLAFKNPFLARPQLSPEDAAEIKGLGGAARAKWAERRVAEAKAASAAAQTAYDDAKANPPPG